jgi:tRNA-2-methylthio-N6-dimethylallyladenosine synthase
LHKKMQEIEITQEELNEQREYMSKVCQIIHNQNLIFGDQKAFVHTFGCQQNVSDSERIKGMLSVMGYVFCDKAVEANLVIFNTCAVREHAENRVFGNIGELKHQKEQNPDMIIGLCGCMMQQQHIAQQIKEKYQQIDLVFGPQMIYRLPELLYKSLTDRKKIFAIDDENRIAEDLPIRREGKLKAFLPIMYGCNNFCSYCIVPYVRGRERSRRPELILKEARELVGQGFKDITLLGQNVNSFGKDFEEDYNFSRLLRELNGIEGDFRIRFMTSHPKDATKELIETMADCHHISKHIHLPVQSGSNRILQLMNRVYTREEYIDLVSFAREKMPELTITSDIIVGFPGETYEDFLDTLELMKKVEFNAIYSFLYSKRKGTPAESMSDQITKEEKSKRFAELLKVQEVVSYNRNSKMVGKTVCILVEDREKPDSDFLTGRTDGNIIVNFVGDEQLIGQFIKVKIVRNKTWILIGELIKK